MNNIQLAIFLENYSVLLSRAIDDVKLDLPQEMKVTTKNILGHVTEEIPAFNPLYAVLNLLDSDIDTLRHSLDRGNS